MLKNLEILQRILLKKAFEVEDVGDDEKKSTEEEVKFLVREKQIETIRGQVYPSYGKQKTRSTAQSPII